MMFDDVLLNSANVRSSSIQNKHVPLQFLVGPKVREMELERSVFLEVQTKSEDTTLQRQTSSLFVNSQQLELNCRKKERF